MIDPVKMNKNTGKWQYSYNGRSSDEFKTKRDAAVAYVNNLVLKEPKYKPLFEGKTWPIIFKMVGIVL